MTAAELQKQILQNALDPRMAESDGLRAEQHSLSDQLALLDKLKGNEAACSKNRGLSFSRLRPPGTVSHAVDTR